MSVIHLPEALGLLCLATTAAAAAPGGVAAACLAAAAVAAADGLSRSADRAAVAEGGRRGGVVEDTGTGLGSSVAVRKCAGVPRIDLGLEAAEEETEEG